MNARSYQRLVHPLLGSQHLEQIFDIPSSKVLPAITKQLNVSISPSYEVGIITLEINYWERSTLESQGWQLLDTCSDIEGVIYSFLRDSLNLTIEIDFRENWPYWAPRMKLLRSSSHSTDLMKLVSQFNCDLRNNWSPALGFDKPLLMLLSRILEELEYV